MNVTTIFRIEKDGIGPWHHPDSYKCDSIVGMMAARIGTNAKKHPTPYYDKPLKEFMEQHGNSIPYCYQCAVDGFDSLINWFGEYEYEMLQLSAAGFKVALISVPESGVIHGHFQVLFDATNVIEKIELDINEVFEPYWKTRKAA